MATYHMSNAVYKSRSENVCSGLGWCSSISWKYQRI